MNNKLHHWTVVTGHTVPIERADIPHAPLISELVEALRLTPDGHMPVVFSLPWAGWWSFATCEHPNVYAFTLGQSSREPRNMLSSNSVAWGQGIDWLVAGLRAYWRGLGFPELFHEPPCLSGSIALLATTPLLADHGDYPIERLGMLYEAARIEQALAFAIMDRYAVGADPTAGSGLVLSYTLRKVTDRTAG